MRTEIEIDIRLIDDGAIVNKINASDIYTLSSQFHAFPHQAFYMHLTSIVPHDAADDWDSKATTRIKKHLEQIMEREDICEIEVNVIFSLRNTVVVDMVRAMNTEYQIVHCSIMKYLIDKKMGKSSKENRERVIALAKENGNQIHFNKTT